MVVALAHSPDTGEESFLVQSAEGIGSNGLDDLSQTTKNSKQSDHDSRSMSFFQVSSLHTQRR
jgi:hypothetical protein